MANKYAPPLFQVGDRVVANTGNMLQTQRAGEICNSFYSTEKKAFDALPVQWDDGTREYVRPEDLDYEYV
jgi:hypothetical protein